MGMLKRNNWATGEHEFSVALMRFSARITIINNGSFTFYKLRVFDSDMKHITMNFYALCDATDFIEKEIDKNSIVSLDQITKKYEEQFAEGKFRPKPKEKTKCLTFDYS